MTDDYLNGNIRDIIEPMISALLIAQPDDPKFFMLHWLKNLYSLDYIIINKQKEELENIKLQIRNLKEKKNEPKLIKSKSTAPKNVSYSEKNDKSEDKKEKEEKSKNSSSEKKSVSENSESSGSSGSVSQKNESKFSFENIFNEYENQKKIFEIIGKPLCDNILKGINSTFMSYGKKNTGKTYTIRGKSIYDIQKELSINGNVTEGLYYKYLDNRGLFNFCLENIFNNIYLKEEYKPFEFIIEISFIEIFDNCVFECGGPVINGPTYGDFRQWWHFNNCAFIKKFDVLRIL